MAAFDIEKYMGDAVKMRGGGKYLPVATSIKILLDAGMLLGSETVITETQNVVRAKVRLKVLNKHIPGWQELPPQDRIGYYEGVAETPFDNAKGDAEKLFPVEVAETSAWGRAARLLGASLGTASADEMALIDVKENSEVGNGRRPNTRNAGSSSGGKGGGTSKVASEKQTNFISNLMIQAGANTESKQDKLAAAILNREDAHIGGKEHDCNITSREASTIIEKLKETESVPF